MTSHIGWLRESRTIGEHFQDWMRTNPDTDWGTYWDSQLRECVALYEKYGWKLLPIAKNQKIPVKGVHWTQVELTYGEALHLLQEKMNLAVDLRRSELIVCDIDNRIIPDNLVPFTSKTISVISPRGYHIYFHYDKSFNKKVTSQICKKLGREQLFRGGENKNQYVLVPLSCVDNKLYEFIYTSRLMDFSKFVDQLEREVM